jgi:hypothetical protein
MKQGDVTTQGQATILPSNYIGQFNYDMTTASGTYPVTGVGFKPSAIIFFAGSVDTDGSWGVANATDSKCIYDGRNDGTYQRNQSAIMIDKAASDYQEGIVTSFDPDGFTITFTKNGSPTGTMTVVYIAFK